MRHHSVRSARRPGVLLALLLAGLSAGSGAALAQQQPPQQGQQQWFVPGQGGGAAGAQPRPAQPPAQPQPRPAQAQVPAAPLPEAPPPPPISIQQLPPLAPSAPPPAPVIGVLDLDRIQGSWTPYAGLLNAIRGRVNRLRADEQRERQALDEATRAFVAQRPQLNQDQQRNRQREIENRAAELSRQFGERQREVQTLAQTAEQLEQIIRVVLSQVSQARGINLVLRTNHVVLNHPSIDITNDVLSQLQLVPVQVQIPPDLPPPPAAQAPAPPPAVPPAAPAQPRRN
jgi:Skp family chaperone for outer membrane proteins